MIHRPRGKEAKQKTKKISTTDPDATLTTGQKDYPLQPSYKQHTVSDDQSGVIVDVEVTTGEDAEGRQLMEAVDRTEKTTGIKVTTVTADAGYAYPTNYEAAEKREITAIIPPAPDRTKYTKIPMRRFRYDAGTRSCDVPGGESFGVQIKTPRGGSTERGPRIVEGVRCGRGAFGEKRYAHRADRPWV